MDNLDVTNARILIIEDNEGYLERIINRLTKFGYLDLDVARTEDEAKIKLEQELYDVIVADMRLKRSEYTDEMNASGGFVIVEEVRRLKITSIVIILTANDSVKDCRNALKDGRCWDYITKGLVEGSALDELHRSIQEGLAYLNHWGNRYDEEWIEENEEYLLNNYRGKYIAVINNTVIESADTEEDLRRKIQERRLPLFLPVIQKIGKKEVKTMIWIIYDLGVKGDYESLYAWLDEHGAKECGNGVAVLEYEIKDTLFEELRKELSQNINLNKHDRIYIIWREDQKLKGQFLFGKRKASPWSGYGSQQTQIDEEE